METWLKHTRSLSERRWKEFLGACGAKIASDKKALTITDEQLDAERDDLYIPSSPSKSDTDSGETGL